MWWRLRRLKPKRRTQVLLAVLAAVLWWSFGLWPFDDTGRVVCADRARSSAPVDQASACWAKLAQAWQTALPQMRAVEGGQGGQGDGSAFDAWFDALHALPVESLTEPLFAMQSALTLGQNGSATFRRAGTGSRMLVGSVTVTRGAVQASMAVDGRRQTVPLAAGVRRRIALPGDAAATLTLTCRARQCVVQLGPP